MKDKKSVFPENINFTRDPEATLLKHIFSVIKDSVWNEHSFTFSFKAKKNETGKGFQVSGLKIKDVKEKKLVKYKSDSEKRIAIKEKLRALMLKQKAEYGRRGGMNRGKNFNRDIRHMSLFDKKLGVEEGVA